MLIGPSPPEPLELKYFPALAIEPELSVANSNSLEATMMAASLPSGGMDSEGMEEDDVDPPAPLLRSQSLQDDFKCCICLNLMYDPTSLTCGHSGCLQCMKKAIKRKSECPICKTKISQSLVVTIALRNAMMRLFPDYGPSPAVTEAPSQWLHNLLENRINLRETLHSLCRHYGLQYSEDDDNVCFNLLSTDGEKITSFSHSSFPFHRLVTDRRFMHPAYASLRDRQAALVSQIRLSASVDTATDLLSDSVLYAILPILCTPLYCRQLWHQEWTEFQELFAAATGEPLSPFSSRLSLNALLPNRLLRKLCRRAGGLFESPLALHKIRDMLKEFLTTMMIKVLLIHEQLHLPLITCDHLLRIIPQILPRGKDLQVYGYGAVGNIRHLLSGSLLKVLKQVHATTTIDEVALSVIHDQVVTVAIDLLHSARTYHVEEPVTYRRYSMPISTVNASLASSGVPTDGIVPWEFVFYDLCEDGEEKYANVITARDIVATIDLLIPGDLAKHAKSECMNAIRKLSVNRAAEEVFPIEPIEKLRRACGLIVCPAAVTLIAQSSPGLRDVRLSLGACVSLATVVEYLSAELFELSGKAARDMESQTILPRHVNLAVQFDQELIRLFPGIVRNGGVIPRTPPSQILPNLLSSEVNSTATIANYVERVTSAGDVIPHPLCGRYVGPIDDSADDANSSEQFQLLPILDGLAYVDSGEAMRQVSTLRLAPTEVREAVVSVGKNPVCTFHRRRKEINREYHLSTMFPIFTHEVMVHLCAHVVTEVLSLHHRGAGPTPPPPFFTAEAIDLMSTLSEGYIIRLLTDAYIVARHSDRLLLTPLDIECARRIRGERF